jgi:hypothetical protein
VSPLSGLTTREPLRCDEVRWIGPPLRTDSTSDGASPRPLAADSTISLRGAW